MPTTAQIMRDQESPFGERQARAIIRDQRLTLTRPPMFLQARRTLSYSSALRDAGTTLCDLEMHRSELTSELLVRFVPEGSESDSAVETLLSWAELAGFDRVWLPDRIVELDCSLVPDPSDLEQIPCPTCGVEATELTAADEIATMRRRGHQPRFCPVCGARTPERVAARQDRSTT